MLDQTDTSSNTSTPGAHTTTTTATTSHNGGDGCLASQPQVLGSVSGTGTGTGCFARVAKRPVVHEGGRGEMKRVLQCFSNDVVIISDALSCSYTVAQNQRLSMVVCVGCRNCTISILDSVVLTSRTVRMVNCDSCTLEIEDVDARKVECYGTVNSKVVVLGDEALLENVRILWREGCSGNTVQRAEMSNTLLSYTLRYKVLNTLEVPPSITAKQWCTSFFPINYIHNVLLATADDDGIVKVTSEGEVILEQLNRVTQACLPEDDAHKLPKGLPTTEAILRSLFTLRATPFLLSKAELQAAYDAERVEYEDSVLVLQQKVREVAEILKRGSHNVCFTGAGISTSGGIPDFRGPQGMWTLKDKGEHVKGKNVSRARPTLAHYAVTELARRNLLHFIITTNMDGLHLRSGLPPHMIVELHGSCYKEWCRGCGKTHLRSFDVMTGFPNRDHITGRSCKWCHEKLMDTIVHFSDLYRTPMDPMTALYHSRKANAMLVLGSSLNVQSASSYPEKCLGDSAPSKLIIVNLQNTPYDSMASVRVYARTDVFMAALMQELGISSFDTEQDCLHSWDLMDPEEQAAKAAKKYNVYTMADDGPPPESILNLIRAGQYSFRNTVETIEKHGPLTMGGD